MSLKIPYMQTVFILIKLHKQYCNWLTKSTKKFKLQLYLPFKITYEFKNCLGAESIHNNFTYI
jgi:hypothetical protein